jgi:rod shape-determining protein MreC
MNRDTRKTRILLALLLTTSIALITIDFRGGAQSPVTAVRELASSLFGPVQRGAAAVVSPVARAVDRIGRLGEQENELERLRRENEALRLELRSSEVARARAAELDALLGIAGLAQYEIVPAQVISFGPERDFAWTVTIDAGSRDGLAPDMTVLNGEGLVGRITSLGEGTATVLLASDPIFSAGVRAESTLDMGTVTGRGGEPLALTMLDPQTPLEPGDRLVTSGSRTFASGVPVGEVASVQSTPGTLTRVGTVTPYVDFSALDLVGVIVQRPRDDPRDSLLPPPPATSQAPDD